MLLLSDCNGNFFSIVLLDSTTEYGGLRSTSALKQLDTLELVTLVMEGIPQVVIQVLVILQIDSLNETTRITLAMSLLSLLSSIASRVVKFRIVHNKHAAKYLTAGGTSSSDVEMNRPTSPVSSSSL